VQPPHAVPDLISVDRQVTRGKGCGRSLSRCRAAADGARSMVARPSACQIVHYCRLLLQFVQKFYGWLGHCLEASHRLLSRQFRASVLRQPRADARHFLNCHSPCDAWPAKGVAALKRHGNHIVLHFRLGTVPPAHICRTRSVQKTIDSDVLDVWTVVARLGPYGTLLSPLSPYLLHLGLYLLHFDMHL